MTASSPLRNAAPRPGATRAPLTSLRGGVNSPEASSASSMIARRTEPLVTVVRLAWWAALKFALCTVLAYGGSYVLGYVLPFLRFFSQIPW